MSTFNVSQKIGTGGAFLKTTGGSTTILTTTAGQYAKVRIQGYIVQNAAGSGSLTMSVGGTAVRTLNVGGTGDAKSLHSARNPDTSGSDTGVHFMDVIVPPSSNLVIAATLSITTLNVSGTYVIIENTL